MRQKPFLKIALYILLFSFFTGAASAQFLGGGPAPGSIYKEFTFQNDNNNWRVTDPGVDLVRHPEAAAFLPNPILNLSVDDLEGAVSAEVVIDFWGGHEGTTDKKLRFNGNAWITIPELDDPSICVTGPCPSPGNKYLQQLNHVIPVPLSDLIAGINEIEGTSGPNSWDWGQWGWYGLILRVYYNSGKPHATGQIASIQSGDTFFDNPTISVNTSGGANRVDVLAYYDGYDTDGDGNFADYQRNYHRSSFNDPMDIKKHVGTDTSSPFAVTWNTQWVPDQASGAVKLLARIRNGSGYWYVTPEVENLTLQRNGLSVKHYAPYNVPQVYWVRDGQIKSSKVDIPSLFNATAAIMHVATWNGNEIGSSFYNKVNDWTAPAYGKDHFYSYDEIAVPISALNTGENTITFQSSTIHHGIEIMWPGPGITVRYVSGCQASDTTIDIWYGPNQIFAEVGIPQRWINILGRVTDGDGIDTLTYSLNGSAELPLTVGPDNRRLQDPGDFNVEISYIDPDLLLGTNEVVITATDPCGNQTVRTVYFEFGDGTIWPLPYTVDWNDYLNLQDVAQVQAVQILDGLWVLDSDADVGIRSVNTGYDRLVAIGDMDWDDYEVTVPITIHDIDATTGPVSGPPGVGVLMRWDGHYDWDGSQPTWGYYPMGALAWYRYLTDSLGARLRMIGGYNGRFLAEDTSGFKLSFGVRYIFKVRVETIPGQGGRYSLKVWEDGEPEPSDWNLVAQGTLSDPQNGSFLLLAHHADVTFGNISVTPLLIRDIAITTGDTWATINWTTTEPATSSVAYGPTQAYENGSVDDFSLVTDHSITLTNLNLGDLYHCQITSVAAGGFSASSEDLTFRTKLPSNIVSDNFNAPSLDVGLWEIVNPVGDGSVEMTGAQVALSVPAGVDHDLWTAGNRSLRIMQPVNDTDFEFDVKFDSSLGARYQIQGVLAEESDGTYVRFDFFSDGSATRIFAASFVNDVPTVRGNTVVTAGAPSYIRMKRVGDQWTQFYSSNGTNWNNGASFTFPLSVSKVGVFAGNAGTNPPAYTALVDYFLNTASPPVAPTITTQPADQTVVEGATATFVVAADGTAPLSYQWRKDGVDITGATSASYTTPPTVLADDGALFDCVVDNPANSPATSRQALLTVTSAPVAPSITTQPADQTVVEGATATFMVAADGTAPLSYQWRKDGVDITGATSASYTTPPTVLADDGALFDCVVDNPANSPAASRQALLTVTSAPVAPSITTQPADQTVVEGATATFMVAADGTAPLSYQWRKDGVDITGATSASYTTPPTVLADDGALFDCVVDNPANSPATSRQALLTVTSAPVAPSITTQPADQTVVEGATATFMMAADGTAPLSYQWRKDGVNHRRHQRELHHAAHGFGR